MNNRNYILNEHGEPVLCHDFMKWARWFEVNKNRVVKQEIINEIQVSTVFLGLDHQYGKGPPILWETMLFRGRKFNPLVNREVREDVDGYQTRCAGGREQAEAMHEEACQFVRDNYSPEGKRITTGEDNTDAQ